MRGRRKVRIAHAKVDNVRALGAQFGLLAIDLFEYVRRQPPDLIEFTGHDGLRIVWGKLKRVKQSEECLATRSRTIENRSELRDIFVGQEVRRDIALGDLLLQGRAPGLDFRRCQISRLRAWI